MFSFLVTKSKSRPTLSRLLFRLGFGHATSDLVQLYYSYSSVIRQHRRKYMNKQFLVAMVSYPDNPHE